MKYLIKKWLLNIGFKQPTSVPVRFKLGWRKLNAYQIWLNTPKVQKYV